MTLQLPERPNLEQLKRQAKDLLRAAQAKDPAALARFRTLPALAANSPQEIGTLKLALHDAQSALAREHGFPSWNALRDRVEELTLEANDAAIDFTRAVIDRRMERAQRLLARFPGFTAINFHAALAFGDLAAVRTHVEKKPALLREKGGPFEWEPLLYVAHSRWAEKNSAGLVAVASYLLAQGADPNTSYPWEGDPKSPLSVLWAAACHARHYALAQVLLEAGAKPDDGESVYHAAENGDIAMLDLLAAHGARADGGAGRISWSNTPLYFILGHYVGLSHDAETRRGAAWLLAHGANPNCVCYPDKSGETPMHVAARHWDAEMIDLLVAHGGDIHARRKDGKNVLTLAELNGRISAAEALRQRGAVDELTRADKFIAACMRGDRAEAERLRDPAVIAANGAMFLETSLPAAETMLAVGFDITTLGNMGETALHWAAFTGNAEKARMLIAHGAPIEARDKQYNAPPLGWCCYASLNRRPPQADFPGVARALLEAGASLDDEREDGAADDVLEVMAEFRRARK